jgi:hypothetical protein
MAHEAHALYELMGSYQLGDLVRPTQASHTSSVTRVAGNHRAAEQPAADSKEKPPARAAARSPARAVSRAPGHAQLAAAAVVEDSEWQEF